MGWTVQEYSDMLVIQDDAKEVARVIRRGVNEREWAEEFNTARHIAAMPGQLDMLLTACKLLVKTFSTSIDAPDMDDYELYAIEQGNKAIEDNQ